MGRRLGLAIDSNKLSLLIERQKKKHKCSNRDQLCEKFEVSMNLIYQTLRRGRVTMRGILDIEKMGISSKDYLINDVVN